MYKFADVVLMRQQLELIDVHFTSDVVLMRKQLSNNTRTFYVLVLTYVRIATSQPVTGPTGPDRSKWTGVRTG